MVIVALAGEVGDNSLGSSLFRRLSENFSVTHIDAESGRILHGGDASGEEILICEMQNLRTFIAPSMLVIVKSGGKSLISCNFPKGTAAIVHADDARLLRGTGLAPITCGNGSKDTVSFSSKSEDRVVVTLQRAVKAFCGEMVEPFELPLEKGSDDDFTLLAYVAVCAKIGFIGGKEL